MIQPAPVLLRDRHCIGGEWVGSLTTCPVTDPANGELIAEVWTGRVAEMKYLMMGRLHS